MVWDSLKPNKSDKNSEESESSESTIEDEDAILNESLKQLNLNEEESALKTEELPPESIFEDSFTAFDEVDQSIIPNATGVNEQR